MRPSLAVALLGLALRWPRRARMLLVPDARVCFAGNLFWRRVAPSLIGATVSAWIGSLAELLQRPTPQPRRMFPGKAESLVCLTSPSSGNI